MSTDIIGDIHGNADRLIALLSRLGYSRSGGAWRHPRRCRPPASCATWWRRAVRRVCSASTKVRQSQPAPGVPGCGRGHTRQRDITDWFRTLPLWRDLGGEVRDSVRVRWWQDDLCTYRQAAIGPRADMEKVPDVALPAEWAAHRYAGPPVLFGHHWFSGAPAVISPRFACLDFSGAHGGPLVAYRWDGESRLSSDKLAWV